MSIGSTFPAARHSAPPTPEDENDDGFQWDAPSPTDSETSTNDSLTTSPETSPSRYHPSTTVVSATKRSTIVPGLPLKPSSHPYSNAPVPNRQARPRQSGLTPLTNGALPLGTGALPKSQPLSRALFARMANDTPHAGMVGKKKVAGGQKLIVPTKGFRRTFELDLSANELARK